MEVKGVRTDIRFFQPLQPLGKLLHILPSGQRCRLGTNLYKFNINGTYQLIKLSIHSVEAFIHHIEATIHGIETSLNDSEPLIDKIKPMIYDFKALVYGVKPTIYLRGKVCQHNSKPSQSNFVFLCAHFSSVENEAQKSKVL